MSKKTVRAIFVLILIPNLVMIGFKLAHLIPNPDYHTSWPALWVNVILAALFWYLAHSD